MNFDSLFITSGVHKDEFLNSQYKNYDKILNKYGTKTKLLSRKTCLVKYESF